MTLIIIGGLVSLVSTLTTIAVQHLLSLRKQKYEMRGYPREALFNKQTEFYDKAVQVLRGVNEYITTLDVWLREISPKAKEKVQEYKGKTQSVWEFHELMEAFSIYLPDKILRAGDTLFHECFLLSNSPSVQKAEKSIDLLFSFQRTIRECVGADKISDDLLKAFGAHRRKRLAGDDGKA